MSDTTTKGIVPTSRELRILVHAADIRERMNWYLTTSRSVPLRVVKSCIRKGWLRILDHLVEMEDGDGFSIQPTRYAIGYELTDAGRALATAEEERERAAQESRRQRWLKEDAESRAVAP